MLGGLLVLVTYLVGALVPQLSMSARLALAAAPLVWIVAKELLRSHYYQGRGRVAEVRSRTDKRWHLGFTLFTAAVSAFIVVVTLMRTEPASLTSFETLGYLGYVVAMPFLVWFFMRTALEFIVGVFLVAQAALMLGGGNYELGQQLQAPIVAIVFIVIGIRQHLEFLDLSRQLTDLRSRTQ